MTTIKHDGTRATITAAVRKSNYDVWTATATALPKVSAEVETELTENGWAAISTTPGLGLVLTRAGFKLGCQMLS